MMTQHEPIVLFLSYAHEDEALLRQLETHLGLLKQQGVISIWYDRQIAPGTDWATTIDNRLEQAAIILLLISPDFLASDYCYQVEMRRALQLHRAGQARVIPIVLRPTDWKDAPFAHLQALPTDARAITTWSNQDEAFLDVVKGLRRVIEELPLQTGRRPDLAQPLVWNIPYARNPVFTGREQLLAHLETALQPGKAIALSQPQVQAISGLGGIGKTQIAVEYAYRHRQDYRVILWSRADTHEALVSGYVEIAQLLNLPHDLPQKKERLKGPGIWVLNFYPRGWRQRYEEEMITLLEQHTVTPATTFDLLLGALDAHLDPSYRTADEQDQSVAVDAVLQWFKMQKQWLFILDNADELALVREFLPPTFGGHILLTTRAQAMGKLAKRIEVETMDADAGALLLLRRAGLIEQDALLEAASPSDPALAKEISQELGGLPLALDQAGAYLEETGSGLCDYLQIYQQHQAEMLKKRGGLLTDHPDSVATTWSLSLERVEQKNKAAAELLRLCAYLAPDAIPQEMLLRGASHLGPLLEPVVSDAFLLGQARETLRAYSLMGYDPRTSTLSMHRLTQAVLRESMDESSRKCWAERALRVVYRALPAVEPTKWSQWEQLVMHAQTCVTWIEQEGFHFPEAISLLEQTGQYLIERAHYSEAEVLLVRAYAMSKQELGADHLEIVRNALTLAALYSTQGKYAQAEPLYQRVLEIHMHQLGPNQPDTAISLNTLAALYRNQGKHEQAEPLYQ
ncbi:MAG: toll/interleukin-1 receptor domain-containing protein, partial [Chloroflexi bacterium]|nr:toll/interleukin-1 receptor domain-containing protein [Chloroflexota bacterium]